MSTFVFILIFIIIFKIQDRSKNKVEKTKAIIENPKENIPLEENLDEKILKENSLPKNYEKIASREDDSLSKNTGEEYLINEWNLNYTLQRIDQMSGSFDQIKLFATIEKT